LFLIAVSGRHHRLARRSARAGRASLLLTLDLNVRCPTPILPPRCARLPARHTVVRQVTLCGLGVGVRWPQVAAWLARAVWLRVERGSWLTSLRGQHSLHVTSNRRHARRVAHADTTTRQRDCPAPTSVHTFRVQPTQSSVIGFRVLHGAGSPGVFYEFVAGAENRVVEADHSVLGAETPPDWSLVRGVACASVRGSRHE